MSAQAANQAIYMPFEPDPPRRCLSESVRTAMESYFARLDGSQPDDLYRMVMEEVERPLLETVMRHCGGNQTRAAQHLGLNRGTLRKKLKHYRLE